MFDPAVGWYTVTPVVGHDEITVEEAMGLEEAPQGRGGEVDESAAVVEMRQSIENEVNPFPDE